MTSNVGSQMIQRIAEEGGDESDMESAVHEALQARFLPEFLNRIDDVIVFHPLARDEIRRIVDLQIDRLAAQLAKRDLALQVTEAARLEIANAGYDPTYGARPLKRVIQQRLQNPLATELLKGQYPEGSGVRIDFDGIDFTFEQLDPTRTQVETVSVG
jgi:ATP-dependent Clp protease ATP-binding subunit ClpB